jgi:putative phosphoribosyl transferase
MMAMFADRAIAGQLLAKEVARLRPEAPVVFALPRGGVPVAAPIATALNAPLDLLLVRKIGVPWQPELAAGSVIDGERPDIVLNDDVVRAAGLSPSDIRSIADAELKEVERRRAIYMPGRSPTSAKGRTAILVDDGMATGASMRAAVAAVRRRGPRRIIVAIPVAAAETAQEFRAIVDDVVCLVTPRHFGSVGYYYDDFRQLSDADVTAVLASLPALSSQAAANTTGAST